MLCYYFFLIKYLSNKFDDKQMTSLGGFKTATGKNIAIKEDQLKSAMDKFNKDLNSFNLNSNLLNKSERVSIEQSKSILHQSFENLNTNSELW